MYQIKKLRLSMGSSKIEKIKRKQKNACYVLITCGEPNAEGKMNVEMTYEGEPLLAAYLLENAQSIIDERISNS